MSVLNTYTANSKWCKVNGYGCVRLVTANFYKSRVLCESLMTAKRAQISILKRRNT